MIDFHKVRFSYDGQRNALDGVDLHIEQGSFVCILGGNGSGKSTLARHINALLLPDDGYVEVLGRRTDDADATFFIRSNAGMVFQNPDDQLVASLIENDVAFGPENLGVPSPELRERVTEALAAVGLQGFEKKETSALSGGQKQRVAIAGMLAMRPQILVLDEASAMLDPRGRAGLMRVCRELNDAGMTIVMITHFMEEAAAADVVHVLDAGRIALSGTPDYVLGQVELMADLSLDIPFAAKTARALQKAGLTVAMHVDEAGLVAEILNAAGVDSEGTLHSGVADLRASQGEVKAAAEVVAEASAELAPESETNAPAPTNTPSTTRPQQGVPRVEFRKVSFSYDPHAAKKAEHTSQAQADWGNAPDALWALKDVSFSLYAGEMLGIAGHTGSGKSTLVQHMNGLLAPVEGQVLVDGADIADKQVAADVRSHVGLVFQYPEHQLFAATVFDDVAFGPRNLGVPQDDLEGVVREALALVDLDFDMLRDMSPFELSGGQQRRVALAGVLAMQPSTLILDEPAAGLDPAARRDLLELIRRLHAESDRTIVIISHSMDDLAELCDRILVLNTGRVFAQGTPAEVFADAARMKKIGLDVPASQRLANALIEQGLVLPQAPEGLYSQDSVVDAIVSCCRRVS